MICEMGTRKGGSLSHILNALIEGGDTDRNVVFIDPYGEIEYAHKEGQILQRSGYDNRMRNEALSNIYRQLGPHPMNVIPMIMEDTEFFLRFADGVPFYQAHKVLQTEYALVFFDGPHDVASILREIFFFHPRSPAGAMWVFDDVTRYYDHDQIERVLFPLGWKLVEKTRHKASYLRGPVA